MSAVEVLTQRPAWWGSAACAGLGNALFFSEDDELAVMQAKAVCATCPVAERCMEDALAWDDEGVRGGKTLQERRRYRRRLYRAGTFRANVARCGTPSGYNRHRRRGEHACAACREAQRIDKAHRKAERVAS